MKFTITSLVFVVFSVTSFSQKDTIITYSGERFSCKILNVTEKKTSYKEADTDDGPTFEVRTRKIKQIILESGREELVTKIKRFNEKDLSRNSFIGIDLLGPPSLCGGVTYEYTFFKHKLSMLIPLSIGLKHLNEDVDNNAVFYDAWPRPVFSKVFLTGMQLNYFPFDFRKNSFFIGPGFHYEQFKYDFRGYITSNGVKNYVRNFNQTGTLADLLINVGFRHYFTNKFSFRYSVGGGLKKITVKELPSEIEPTVYVEILFGYTF